MSILLHAAVAAFGAAALFTSSVPQHRVDLKMPSLDGIQRIDPLWMVTYVDHTGQEVVGQAKLTTGEYVPLPSERGVSKRSRVMGHLSPHAPISPASRRRLARWLVGTLVADVERDLVLETLHNTSGNRTASARLLGVSIRTLRNKIKGYSAEGVDVPRRENWDNQKRVGSSR